jgi:hypothetical protein
MIVIQIVIRVIHAHHVILENGKKMIAIQTVIHVVHVNHVDRMRDKRLIIIVKHILKGRQKNDE